MKNGSWEVKLDNKFYNKQINFWDRQGHTGFLAQLSTSRYDQPVSPQKQTSNPNRVSLCKFPCASKPRTHTL